MYQQMKQLQQMMQQQKLQQEKEEEMRQQKLMENNQSKLIIKFQDSDFYKGYPITLLYFLNEKISSII